MSRLRGHLERQERDELARAIRELLAAPFRTDDDAVFDIIRRRRDRLTDWFERNCGWRQARDLLLRDPASLSDATIAAGTSSSYR